jgi:hypothetical protein
VSHKLVVTFTDDALLKIYKYIYNFGLLKNHWQKKLVRFSLSSMV